jgi:hypothetical protein
VSNEQEQMSGMDLTRAAIQELLGSQRLVTKALVVVEAIDVVTGEPELILRAAGDYAQWDREGLLRYALRIEESGTAAWRNDEAGDDEDL